MIILTVHCQLFFLFIPKLAFLKKVILTVLIKKIDEICLLFNPVQINGLSRYH